MCLLYNHGMRTCGFSESHDHSRYSLALQNKNTFLKFFDTSHSTVILFYTILKKVKSVDLKIVALRFCVLHSSAEAGAGHS